jgi:DNA topoisomerase IA
MMSSKSPANVYQVGQIVNAVSARYKSEKTTAPKRYDMATILDAMLSADRFAKTPQDREILRQVDGIGTARTRQGIVDGLIKKGLLRSEKKGKRFELHPNDIAKELRSMVPPILGDVAMTAKWELGFSMIERGEVDWRQMVDKTYGFVEQIVQQAKSQKGTFSAGVRSEPINYGKAIGGPAQGGSVKASGAQAAQTTAKNASAVARK